MSRCRDLGELIKIPKPTKAEIKEQKRVDREFEAKVTERLKNMCKCGGTSPMHVWGTGMNIYRGYDCSKFRSIFSKKRLREEVEGIQRQWRRTLFSNRDSPCR